MSKEVENLFKDLSLVEQIEAAEKEFLKQEQVSCPVTHSFGPGIYMRQVFIPAGTFSIGHYQKETHMNILLTGKVTMRGPDGKPVTLKAPMTFTADPGRKIGYIHEDMTWINVYATDETDIQKLEERFLLKSDTWKDSVNQLESIQLVQRSADHVDFVEAIKEFGFTEEQVRKQSEELSDMIGLPHGNYKFKVSDSQIDGEGVIAMGDIEEGEVIGLARIGSKRTILGRYTNHSVLPNAVMRAGEDGNIYLVATRKIIGCRGGLDGEEITINYRESVKLTRQLGWGE